MSIRSAAPPGSPATARIVEPYTPWAGVTTPKRSDGRVAAARPASGSPSQRRRRPCGSSGRRAATQPAITSTATSTSPRRIARSACRSREIVDPRPRQLRGSLRSRSRDATGIRSSRSTPTARRREDYAVLDGRAARSSSRAEEAADSRLDRRRRRRAPRRHGHAAVPSARHRLPRAATCSRGLMYGARVSLFIGIVAPLLFVLLRHRLWQRRGLRGRAHRSAADARSPISWSRCRSCCS